MFTLSLIVTMSLQFLFERSSTRVNNISARHVVPDSLPPGDSGLSEAFGYVTLEVEGFEKSND
jgi:hypothetical protein